MSIPKPVVRTLSALRLGASMSQWHDYFNFDDVLGVYCRGFCINVSS